MHCQADQIHPRHVLTNLWMHQVGDVMLHGNIHLSEHCTHAQIYSTHDIY